MEISFKAVLFDIAGRVLLGTNPRGEWELLGGRPEAGDFGPHDTIARELTEEAGVAVRIGDLVDIWYYQIPGAGSVAIASYIAYLDDSADIVPSEEHTELQFFGVDELAGLNMPTGYKTTIRAASRLASADRAGTILGSGTTNE